MSNNPKRETVFRMKRFEITNRDSAMKPGTDGVLLGAWATAHEPRRIIDAGTGTGLIALMMAQRYPEAIISAVEIEETAANEAEMNFSATEWADRLIIVKGDFAQFVSFSKFDLIVSNPPFFTTGQASPSSKRAMARHESSLPFSTLFAQSAKLLSEDGTLAIITPSGIEDEIIYNASLQRLYPRRVCRVISVEGKPPKRIMWEFSRHDGEIIHEQLIIRDQSDNFTDRYRNLTKDFYLDF